MTAPEGVSLSSRRRRVLLGAWVLAGWLSAVFVAGPLRGWLEEYRSRTTGPSYGLANDAAAALGAKLNTPERMAELLGVPAAPLRERDEQDKVCGLTFTDRERTYIHARRANRARPETAWLAVTTGGRAVLGHYAADLWSGNCAAGPTELNTRHCTVVERVRLIEKRELHVPVGTTASAEVMPILAGQCLWRTFTGKAGVVGRYQIRLPAERDMTVRTYVLPATAFLSYRLTLEGREAAHAGGENTMFQSLGEGTYELEVTLQPATDEPERPGEYTLQIHWGRGAGDPCPMPSFDERECYGVGLPKSETP